MSRFRVARFVTIAFILTGTFAWSQSSDQIGPPSTWQSNTPKPAGPAVSGTVAYRERIALPPNAAIEVKLQDVSLQDAPAKTVAETVFAAEENRVMRFEFLRHVVGVEDRDLRRAGEPGAAHEGDVDPGNRENTGAAVRGGGNGTDC